MNGLQKTLKELQQAGQLGNVAKLCNVPTRKLIAFTTQPSALTDEELDRLLELERKVQGHAQAQRGLT